MQYAHNIDGITEILSQSHKLADEILLGSQWSELNQLLTQHRYQSSSIPRLQYTHILPILACQAIGGTLDHAIPLAVSWQFRLIAAQLLDDLQDGDNTGCWKALSIGERLMAATFFQGAAEKALTRLPASCTLGKRITEKMADTTMLAATGQCFPSSHSLDAYFAKLSHKTALLFSTACWAGAVIGKASKEEIKLLDSFGWHVGAMRQIVDDCTDLEEDIQRGEWTLPVLYVLSLPGADNFQKMLSEPEKSPSDIEIIMALISEHQAVEWALGQAAQRQSDALAISVKFPFHQRLQEYVHF